MTYVLGFDIGGTFTDAALLDPDGQVLGIHKLLTTPNDPARGALEGIEVFLSRCEVARAELSRVVQASTLVTNALIEGKGALVGLVTIRGFRDVLEMGTEQRYDNYDLSSRMSSAAGSTTSKASVRPSTPPRTRPGRSPTPWPGCTSDAGYPTSTRVCRPSCCRRTGRGPRPRRCSSRLLTCSNRVARRHVENELTLRVAPGAAVD